MSWLSALRPLSRFSLSVLILASSEASGPGPWSSPEPEPVGRGLGWRGPRQNYLFQTLPDGQCATGQTEEICPKNVIYFNSALQLVIVYLFHVHMNRKTGLCNPSHVLFGPNIYLQSECSFKKPFPLPDVDLGDSIRRVFVEHQGQVASVDTAPHELLVRPLHPIY